MAMCSRLLLVLSFIGLTMLGCQATPSNNGPMETSEKCLLRVGFDNWPPYQYLNDQQQVVGSDIQVMQPLFAKMGCELSFVRGNWFSLLADLASGDVDVLIGASHTAARAEYAWFSEPYRHERFKLYVRAEFVPLLTVRSVSDFIQQGHSLGVIADYVYGNEVEALRQAPNSNSQFKVALLAEVNLSRLLNGQIDGFLEDDQVTTSLLRSRAQSRVKALDFNVTEDDIRVMFSKKTITQAQLQRFNKILAEQSPLLTAGQ